MKRKEKKVKNKILKKKKERSWKTSRDRMKWGVGGGQKRQEKINQRDGWTRKIRSLHEKDVLRRKENSYIEYLKKVEDWGKGKNMAFGR